MKNVCVVGIGADDKALRRHCLPKSGRLAGNKEFQTVLARKLCFKNELLTLYVAENKHGRPRLGISVGRSLGNSVQRNRFKRLVREVYRQSKEQIPAGFDYILMPSKKLRLDLKTGTLSLEQLREALLRLVADAKKKIRIEK
jgi:ribonuclease P protein component